jgi:pimeloyl-ACP methyl ester carboxylesterase
MTTAIEPRDRTVEARGLQFHYAEWGRAGAPAIVLLHGITAMCRIWDPLARALQDRYHLLALDQRGHGDTSWPIEPDYATDDFVGDLEALTQLWGLDRFALIGLSMGALNAIAFAGRHPDRITHLVSVDIRPAIDAERRPGLDQAKLTAQQGHPTFDTQEAAYVVRQLSHPITPEAIVRHHIKHQTRQLEDGRWTFKQDPRVSYYWKPGNHWDELPKITAPALIVRAGKSPILPQAVAEKMRDALPCAELVVVEESGHTVPEDRAQEFVDLVEDFLARHPA